MKLLLNSVFIMYLMTTYSTPILADEVGVDVNEESSEHSGTVRGGVPLSEDELESRIGRYGEAEEIPENFEFADEEMAAELRQRENAAERTRAALAEACDEEWPAVPVSAVR